MRTSKRQQYEEGKRKELDDLDSPILTPEFIAGMRPAKETMPKEVFERLTRRRGLQKAPTKQQVTLRLDKDLIEHFKQSGRGWQTHLNERLRELIRGEIRPHTRTLPHARKRRAKAI
jgi:uncharacterized protein (DUF4415 family)